MSDRAKDDLARLLARPIAHRGLHGCGAPGPIENSIGAAKAAARAGYGIECDVQLSRDGEAMVFHDDVLARLTGAPGRLADHDAAFLATLRLGDSTDMIPTLGAFLAVVAGRVPVVIEIKSRDDGDMRLADRTLRMLEPYHGPAAVESFDAGIVRHCRGRGTSRPVGLVGPAEAGHDADPAAVAAADFLSWSIDHLTTIAANHCDLPLSTWTVRTQAQARLAARHGAQIVFEGPDVTVR